jgi:hypothetical protein
MAHPLSVRRFRHAVVHPSTHAALSPPPSQCCNAPAGPLAHRRAAGQALVAANEFPYQLIAVNPAPVVESPVAAAPTPAPAAGLGGLAGAHAGAAGWGGPAAAATGFGGAPVAGGGHHGHGQGVGAAPTGGAFGGHSHYAAPPPAAAPAPAPAAAALAVPPEWLAIFNKYTGIALMLQTYFQLTPADARVLADGNAAIETAKARLMAGAINEGVAGKLVELGSCCDAQDFANAALVAGQIQSADPRNTADWAVPLRMMFQLAGTKVATGARR